VGAKMKLNYVEGDILEAKTQVVVNTVNCKGVMGKGLALQFKKKFPLMYEEYKQQCKEGKITIGSLHLYKQTPRYWILNFPTKNHWRHKSKLEYIEKGLLEFKENYAEWGISSIAFPRLGCQLGGLDWSQVKPIMEKYLADLPGLKVEVFSYKTKGRRSVKRGKPRRKLSRKDATSSNQQSLAFYNKPER
jgi:O-acetyl-ADP-ribose deacetylase (regulator of RNase III)